MGYKPIKPWVLWLIAGITFLAGIGIIVWNIYAQNRTAATVVLMIDLIIMTFSLQAAIARSVKFKPKKRKYKTNVYKKDINEIENSLIENNYSKRDTNFGYVYMKVVGKTAYKVTFINQLDVYLKPVEEDKKDDKKQESFPGLNKCSKFVGFEIFLEVNDVVLERLPDYSFQGKNIFYEGFYFDKEANELKEVNVLDPTEEFVSPVCNLKKDLKLEELVKES